MINIAFQGSTHGNFLRYMLDRYSSLTPAINETPFTKTGTSHNLREEDYSNFFKRTHPHLWGWDPADQPHIVVTIEPEDVLLLQRIVYIRPADKGQDLHSNNIIIDESFNDAESIEKLYGIKINKKVEFKKAKTKNKTELTGFFEKMTEIHVTIKNDAKK